MPSLQNISDSIPATSPRVREYFNKATDPTAVDYPFFMRHVYASLAITCSTANILGYGVTMISTVVTSAIYWDFEYLGTTCHQSAKTIQASLYFTAAMTFHVFLACFGRSLVLTIPETPLELRKEATALVLQSSAPLNFALEEQDLDGSGLRLFYNPETFGRIGDINHLLGFLHSRPDYVLINAPESKAYLVPRSEEQVRAGIMQGTLVLHHLQPVDVQIQEPTSLGASLGDSVLFLSQSLPKLPETPTPPEPSGGAVAVVVRAPQPIPQPVVQAAAPAQAPRLSIGRIVGYNHESKEMKYHHILTHLARAVQSTKGNALFIEVNRSEYSPLKAKCAELYTLITTPRKDIREQHQKFILALREAELLSRLNANQACRAWIDFLALQRFSQVKLYGYCKNLVESVGVKFENPLSLDNFWKQFQAFHAKVKQIPVEQGLPIWVEMWQNLAGHLNVKDFLLTSNVPYIYGQLRKKDKVVTVLRHGTPFSQGEYFGVLNRFWWGEAGNTIPDATADYTAFVDAAHRQNQRILHLVLENGDCKTHGDESARVKARIALAAKPNFFPLAFRFDGPFIEPKNYISKTFVDVKREFLEQMFGKNTGYFVPGKLQQGQLTRDHFTTFMERVQTTFFAGKHSLETLQDFQAFVTLTYAEITLSLCETLDVTYLEAHCKDDIDRGGAMKAIIVLLHLYRTGKFHANCEEQLKQALEELMVNIIAAPLIVKKKPILEKRAVFIHNVIEVMKRAVAVKRVPDCNYSGNFNVVSDQ